MITSSSLTPLPIYGSSNVVNVNSFAQQTTNQRFATNTARAGIGIYTDWQLPDSSEMFVENWSKHQIKKEVGDDIIDFSSLCNGLISETMDDYVNVKCEDGYTQQVSTACGIGSGVEVSEMMSDDEITFNMRAKDVENLAAGEQTSSSAKCAHMPWFDLFIELNAFLDQWNGNNNGTGNGNGNEPSSQQQQQQQQQQPSASASPSSTYCWSQSSPCPSSASPSSSAEYSFECPSPCTPCSSPQSTTIINDEISDDSCEVPSPASGQQGTVTSTGRASGSHIHLWQFLKELLSQPQEYGSCIRWTDRQKGIFKIEDSVRVARLWGKRKNRPAMNYDKLSRSIRQYYKKGIMKKTERSQRLVYQFCHPYCL